VQSITFLPFVMLFLALLIAAIVWNLGTWYLGIPSSSSHTLIGSIIGVGVANALMHGRAGTAGVDWDQATKIGEALLFSPLIEFFAALMLFVMAKAVVRIPALYKEPFGTTPPPIWIRALLVLTCTGVSFAHGSNDGQKGISLIMLILIGIVPTAYALNRVVPASYKAQFHSSLMAADGVFGAHDKPAVPPTVDAARAEVSYYIAMRQFTPAPMGAMTVLANDIDTQVAGYGSLANVPAAVTRNIRNDMYLTASAMKRLGKEKAVTLNPAEVASLDAYKKNLDKATQFIRTWVKVAVAIALGLGTMIGWKRIVVTVGEKIGKSHLTYAQGAVAELVTMVTISAADSFGLPVSTTHVLSSGVAGAMAGNGSGLQMAILRNLAIAWVLTLPVSILLSGVLYVGLSQII